MSDRPRLWRAVARPTVAVAGERISPAWKVRSVGRPSRLLSALLVGLGVAVALGAAPARAQTADSSGAPSALAALQSASQQLLIPAFFHPGDGHEAPDATLTGREKWHRMCNRLRDRRVPDAIIIMNPSDGVFTTRSSSYYHALRYCVHRGQTVIGYVHTRVHPMEASPLRALADVKKNINAYYAFYPAISGIFIDQMGTNAALDPMCVGCPSTNRLYYQRLYAHVKRKAAAAKVVGNPGTAAMDPWHLYARKPSADLLVNFEGPYSSYVNWTPPAWVSGYPASRFAQLVYGAPNDAAITSACTASEAKHASAVFVTQPNNWKARPRKAMLLCPTIRRLPAWGP